ncbi:MAG: 50S ribosomal protein L30 [Clostridia bacterium]|nr:50S ribosomal protein L30 [Clostridia bacterium]
MKVTLIKSTIGCKKNQIDTIKALGLNKIRQHKLIKDNAATRGMINKVSHLVCVSEVKQEAGK